MRFVTWSTLAFVPATTYLLLHRSLLGAVYLASLVVTLIYHSSKESKLCRLDHALAYAVVAANAWMALHARNARHPVAGIVLVLFALVWYRRARERPMEYDDAHGIWHLLCGMAGLSFAIGYVP